MTEKGGFRLFSRPQEGPLILSPNLINRSVLVPLRREAAHDLGIFSNKVLVKTHFEASKTLFLKASWSLKYVLD